MHVPLPDFARSLMTLAACAALLTACGGNGNSSDASGNNAAASAPTGGASSSTASPSGAGTSQALAQQCSPHNPYRGDAQGPTTTASLSREKEWLRSFFDERYLWYREVPQVDAQDAAFSDDSASGVAPSLKRYLSALVVPAKDRFSGMVPTGLWKNMSQSGIQASTGAEWSVIEARPPRVVRIAQVHPNTPAAAAGLQRGDTLVSINGLSVVQESDQTALNLFNEFLMGSSTEKSYSLVVNRQGKDLAPITLNTRPIALPPVGQPQVLNQANGDKVGYLVFNSHNAAAEDLLIQSFNTFKSAGIKDLVLDLRYNGGGYLYIASQLAYMIAGPQQTQNKIFSQLQFNDKRGADTANAAYPFLDVSCKPAVDTGKCTEGMPLPALNLPRVYVLTSSETCSASEAVVNSLEGIGLQVHRVGTTTCGKPYGFSGQDNCGLTYFAIEFKGVNHKGFGDFENGFTAQCEVADDFNHALGNPAEGQLAGALALRATGRCASTTRAGSLSARAVEGPGLFSRSPLQSSAWLGGPIQR